MNQFVTVIIFWCPQNDSWFIFFINDHQYCEFVLFRSIGVLLNSTHGILAAVASSNILAVENTLNSQP
jgi:hypothetical protein